jgi:Flp pilus assembly protein TadG
MAIPGCEGGAVLTNKHAGNRVLRQGFLTARGMRGMNRLLISGIRAMLHSRSEGNALVETAVTLPLVLFLMTGIFSFSIALYQKMELEEAVSTGGRTMAAARGLADPCQTATSAIQAATPSLTQESLTITYSLNGTTTPLVAGTSEGTSCSGFSLTSGANAVVTAQYPCTLAIYGGNLVTCTMTSQVTEVIQ